MALKHPPPDTRWLVVSMIAAVALVCALASWDDERESAAVLADFGQEQATLANAVAVSLATRLEDVRRDALVFADDADTGRRTSAQLANDYLHVRVVPRESPLLESPPE
ncbi:MAG: hypothetical protein ACXU86_03960, partial [Archangium sp.]